MGYSQYMLDIRTLAGYVQVHTRKDTYCMSYAKIYTLHNNKGGVSKTTTTIQLGYGLARRGKRVLILDTDSQCNTTYSLLGGIPAEEDNQDREVKTLYDVIIGINGDPKKKRDLADIIISLPHQPNLYLAQGSIALSAADILLAATGGREKILKRAIDPIRTDFDYILMDTPPTLGLIPVNAYVAAGSEEGNHNGLIIPISPQVYSVLGISTLEEALDQMRSDIEIPLPIFGVVCANAKRTKNAVNRLDQVLEHFGDKVFPYVIPVNEKVEEAADLQISLYDYSPKSTGAIAYTKLTNAFMYRAGDITKEEAITFLKENGLWNEEDRNIWEEPYA